MSNSRVTAGQKAAVKERAQNCCEYCWSQEDYSPDSFSVEHITPIAKGGTNEENNLASACQGCNNRKFTSTDALDPLTGEMAPLYHPRRDHWSDHFVWNYDFTLIVGLTPTGRATVAKLDLNRSSVVNLRRLLAQNGLHPLN
ncbi:MAG: HNH endonuclease signature motif containing protein [Caldilineaceae bacterium]